MSDSREQLMISFEEATSLLNVPCPTLTRWVRQGKIPCRRQGDKIIFSRSELRSWAIEHDIPLIKFHTHGQEKSTHRFSDLVDALERGGAHSLNVVSLKDLFQQVVGILVVASPETQTELVHALLEREAMAPTAVGRGVAFPHPRLPERFNFKEAVVGLFFLDPPLSFDAVDGDPIHLVFALFTPDTRTHLRLMSLLSQLLRQNNTTQFLNQKPSISELLDWLIKSE